jgi:DNA-nicking Smr family endonuclease
MAMDEEGVEPLEFPGVHVPDPPRPDSFTRLPAPPNDDAWALARLTELVSGAGDFDLSFTDEYQEGHKKNVNPSILLNLREGLFPIQAHLDLHGLTLPEAQARLAADIPRFADMGYKTILVIHGKGLGSPDGIPVLKNNLANLLLRTSIRKHILAFVTARPSDGGAGACYVLLHRKPKSARRR